MNTNELNHSMEPENDNSQASENTQNSGENVQKENELVSNSSENDDEINPDSEVTNKVVEDDSTEVNESAEQSVETNTEDTEKPLEEISHEEVQAESKDDTVKQSGNGEKDADEGYSEQDELMIPSESPYEDEDDAPDYSALSKDQLTSELERLLTDFPIQKIRKKVEAIKSQFYKKHQREIAKAKEIYLEANETEEGFDFGKDPVSDHFNELMQIYKDKRTEYTVQIEKAKETNLEEKYVVIEEIKGLINTEESLNKTFQEFRELQDKWRNIGKVPQNEVKKMWEKYHFAVEQFYDYVKINKELRDLDLKKNLKLKEQLCESAESLLLNDSVVKAFKALQEYHQQWREIGPVPRDYKEQIWERFKEATAKVNKRHQEFFENMKDEQQKNLEAKEALCRRVEEINKLNLVKPKKWEEKSKEIIDIQKLWKTIGFAPKKQNNEVYQRFKSACDAFFDAKRDYFAHKHNEEQENLEVKTDLCVQAEAMKESTDWKNTTTELIKLQKIWKQTGPVPRRHSEAIWKRFRSACDAFFDAKKNFFSNIDQRQEDNLEKKRQLIEKVKNFVLTGNDEEDLKALSDFQKEWSEIGFVPFDKKDEIQKEFRQTVNKHFDSMKIEDEKRNLMNFTNKIENWLENPRLRKKITPERNKIINKIKELENEITLYENNIGFFDASKSSSSLIDDIKQKIERAHQRIHLLRNKLDIIDKLDREG